jgi:predicted nuclease of predicted toxin-antitoxin system
VRLLVDENLPPRVAQLLADAGHDAVHVRDLDAAGASDQKIIGLALNSGRTIISADTDFGVLLASTGATGPSVILVREIVDRLPPDLVVLLLDCIEQLEAQLIAGAMVALSPAGARVRRLPLP